MCASEGKLFRRREWKSFQPRKIDFKMTVCDKTELLEGSDVSGCCKGGVDEAFRGRQSIGTELLSVEVNDV